MTATPTATARPDPGGLGRPPVPVTSGKDQEAEGVVNDFGWAAAELKAGRRVQREGWAAKGIWLRLAEPGCTSLPLIIVRRSSGDTASWQPCHNDLLAADWTPVPVTSGDGAGVRSGPRVPATTEQEARDGC